MAIFAPLTILSLLLKLRGVFTLKNIKTYFRNNWGVYAIIFVLIVVCLGLYIKISTMKVAAIKTEVKELRETVVEQKQEIVNTAVSNAASDATNAALVKSIEEGLRDKALLEQDQKELLAKIDESTKTEIKEVLTTTPEVTAQEVDIVEYRRMKRSEQVNQIEQKAAREKAAVLLDGVWSTFCSDNPHPKCKPPTDTKR